MVKVRLNNTVLAESETPVILEGNYYFPPDSLILDVSVDTKTQTDFAYHPGNRSTASYYSADVDGKSVKDIAWFYTEPKKRAANIKNHVAFYKNKVIIED